MNSSSRLLLLMCLALSATAARADGKTPASEHVISATNAVFPAETNAVAVSAESSANVEDLPDLSDVHGPVATLRLAPAVPTTGRAPRVSFTTQQSQGVSPLASMPFATTARHLGAQRFNTDDGSMLADFAICYRMTGRSSVEVIPGDPAPVKLPVVSMANNTGVTVGLVYRLSK